VRLGRVNVFGGCWRFDVSSCSARVQAQLRFTSEVKFNALIAPSMRLSVPLTSSPCGVSRSSSATSRCFCHTWGRGLE
jgi:hypothetical protein